MPEDFDESSVANVLGQKLERDEIPLWLKTKKVQWPFQPKAKSSGLETKDTVFHKYFGHMLGVNFLHFYSQSY